MVVVMLVGVVGEFYTFVGATNLPLIGIGPEIEMLQSKASVIIAKWNSAHNGCVCVSYISLRVLFTI